MSTLKFGPASEKQRMVLQDTTTDVILVGGGAGGGKALRHGSKVLTPSGWKNIEQLVVGDEVVTPSNNIEKVLAVYPQGIVDIYRVSFQDGVFVDTCGNHLWKYHKARRGKNSSVVRTTLEMKKDLESNEGKYRPIIPLTSPLNLSNTTQDFVIPPYMLGVLLGDGCLSHGVSFTTMDEEILEKVKSEGGKIGAIHNNGSKANNYNLLGISKEVRELGLYGTTSETKFIPQKYINSSISNRWDLIQGLFDTDGYVTKDGKTYYDTVSKVLAKDIEYVLRSLGFTVTTTFKIGSYTDKTGEKIICKKVYRLYIRGINQKLLFSISRKKERCKVKDVGNGVRDIELICKDFATCISISGSDKLFVTDNFVVTHNSAMCLTKNLDGINDPHFRCTIFRRTYPELKRQGGLIDESKKIYSHFGAIYKTQACRWDFPSGAQISFSAIADDGDLSGWQGKLPR